MRSDEYRRFTESLLASLEADRRVVGLVALGSMADRDYEPDEWSDHDFFVVTRPGEQEALRGNLSWLPRSDEIALAFRETDHGLKVLYADGHLLEFAVFDLDELRLAPVNRYRVLLDGGGVGGRMDEVAGTRVGSPPREDERFHFGQLLTHVLIGVGRHRRGEAMSGAFFVKGLAVRDLIVLVERVVQSERSSLLDDLDPLRRFDLVYPGIAVELEALLLMETVKAADGLLELARRELDCCRICPGTPSTWSGSDSRSVCKTALTGERVFV
jgi:lincosamide nucleotidyltransferase